MKPKLTPLLLAAAVIFSIGMAAFTAGRVTAGSESALRLVQVRDRMDAAATATAQALARHVPPGVTGRLNVAYGEGGRDALLDVFYPVEADRAGKALPTIVWFHGGAWLAGSKDHVAPYLKILAAQGFTVIGVNYPLAPRHRYPAAVVQANSALAYIRGQAEALRVDPERVFLAGDSAGAQIASQLAAAISDPGYAKALGISPALDRPALRGLILYCGVYDAAQAARDMAGGNFPRVMRTYFGRSDYLADPRIEQFSIVRSLPVNFPPIFASASHDDWRQTRHLLDAARERKVEVDAVLFGENYTPRLPHQFQFDLSLEASRQALARSIAFAKARVK